MASYYYLISSLPTLKAEGESPITYEAFLGMCKSNVSASTYRNLENISTTANNKGPLVSDWSVFYRTLTEELNYQRNIKLGRPAVAPSYRNSEISSAVSAALAAPNPLKSEQILLALEFNKLDSMLGLHYFDDYVLYGYAIKLKLLERQRCFVHEKGQKEFRSLFEGIQQQILNI